jgi:hypothetical protein
VESRGRSSSSSSSSNQYVKEMSKMMKVSAAVAQTMMGVQALLVCKGVGAERVERVSGVIVSKQARRGVILGRRA